MASTDYLLEALKSALPRDIVASRLVREADGVEVFKALAGVFGTCSRDAILDGLVDCFFLTGDRGETATTTLTAIANVPGPNAKRLLAGARFATDDGRVFVSRYYMTWDVGIQSRSVFLDAEQRGAGYNVPEDVITTFLDGTWVDDITGAITTPPTSFAVVSSDAVVDGIGNKPIGRFATLEMLARNRGVYAYDGESAESLRARAWPQPDTVTPAAMVRVATREFWAREPAASAPYQEVGYLDLQEAGGAVAWDCESAWSDEEAAGPQSFWTPPPPWFALFLPVTDDDIPIGSEYDDDNAWDDDGSWDDDDGSIKAAIWEAVQVAIERVRPAGVRAFIFIGSKPIALP